MKDPLYTQFVKKWEEVTELPPQTIGSLTPFYKRTVPFMKVDPWKIIIPVTFIVVAVAFLFSEMTAAQITSLLQRAWY